MKLYDIYHHGEKLGNYLRPSQIQSIAQADNWNETLANLTNWQYKLVEVDNVDWDDYDTNTGVTL